MREIQGDMRQFFANIQARNESQVGGGGGRGVAIEASKHADHESASDKKEFSKDAYDLGKQALAIEVSNRLAGAKFDKWYQPVTRAEIELNISEVFSQLLLDAEKRFDENFTNENACLNYIAGLRAEVQILAARVLESNINASEYVKNKFESTFRLFEKQLVVGRDVRNKIQDPTYSGFKYECGVGDYSMAGTAVLTKDQGLNGDQIFVEDIGYTSSVNLNKVGADAIARDYTTSNGSLTSNVANMNSERKTGKRLYSIDANNVKSPKRDWYSVKAIDPTGRLPDQEFYAVYSYRATLVAGRESKQSLFFEGLARKT